MTEEISAEIRDFVRWSTFKVVMRAETPPYASVLTARSVLTVKNKITGDVRFKESYVVRGHRHRLDLFLVHASKSVQSASVRVLVALFAISNFKIWSTDVKLAYLQADEPLQWETYEGEPAVEFYLDEDMAIQLLKPLYYYLIQETYDTEHSTYTKKHIVK